MQIRPERRFYSFLAANVDGRDLNRPTEESSLAAALAAAGVKQSALMFVELSKEAAETLPVGRFDRYARRILWNMEAFHAVANERGLTMRGRPALKDDIQRKASFFVVPERVVTAAIADGLSTPARGLLLAVLSEMRDLKDGYFPCFGQTKSGYRPSTWARRAGHQRKLGAKRMGELAQLAAAIETLRAWCGLEAALATHERDTDNAVEALRTYANREKEPAGRLLRLYLPEDFMDRFHAPEAETAAAESRLAKGEALRERRKALGWSQARVATLFGRDRSAVSHWERGESRLPLEVIEWLESERELGSSDRA